MTTDHHQTLHRISGEFTSAALESAFWQSSWEDVRAVTRTILRQMPTAYLGVNTILLTLIFYQFLNGRFAFTVGASIFMGLGSMAVGFSHLQMLPQPVSRMQQNALCAIP